MLHPLRKLAREIHRRSVWQVLAGYLIVWWVALEVIERLTAELGLPLWTPAMALILLAIGLPVVLATAVVQGGLPGLRMVDLVDPNELEGRTPDEVHVIPEDHPLYGRSLFTWRNAILGGVMSAALLVTSVVSYLAMWALGIGPVGSLIAQGILTENDTIVVLAFDNRTDNASVAASVAGAIQADLARSSVVTVLDVVQSRSRVGGPARAVVHGAVTRERGAYRVIASIRLADGTALATFEESVPDDEPLDRAVIVLATKLRAKLGEPLRVINAERSTRSGDAAVGPTTP